VTVTPIVRYFYVYGQVGTGANAKQFYTGPITVTQAIAAAGDFTPFAKRTKVRLRRKSDGSIHYINCIKAINDPKLDLWVHPGDTIYVDRRMM
jgi:protein involved in polysaccharide export with SLBB domain